MGLGLSFALAAMWVASGISKLLDPAEFARIVGHHKLVPNAVAQASWLIGAVEAFLGVALIALFARRVPRMIVCAVAGALLLCFAYYIAHIPTESLVKVGCGCQLGLKRVAESAAHSRSWLVTTDIALAALHGFLAFAPATGKTRALEPEPSSVPIG
jgi:uncharacterized membrane protein